MEPLRDLFGTDQPIIAMSHFPPLPGTPLYDERGGVDAIVETMRTDLAALLDGGVDGIMFCNEGDRPYQLKAPPEAMAVMARVITELRPTDRPYGVDFLWDPIAALAVAFATGAAFIREIATGVYESDMGIWAPDAAALYRYRRAIGADGVRIFANVTPEFASPLGSRTPAERARSAVTSSLVDAILVAGPAAGSAPSREVVASVREAVKGQVPVFLNTGARIETVADFLQVADGVIVGSGLKVDGGTWNPVDPARVKAFMANVRAARGA